MNKTGRLPAALLLLLSASLLVSAPTGFPGKIPGQQLPQRSMFYAVEVVFEDRVQNADDALGQPDDSLAEIPPGGQLVVLMEKSLSPFFMAGSESTGCLDSGSVVGSAEVEFRLEGRFSWRDEQGEKHHEWTFLVPTLTGFCVSPPAAAVYSPEDNAGVDLVKITNSGTNSLFVDAVVGFEWMF